MSDIATEETCDDPIDQEDDHPQNPDVSHILEKPYLCVICYMAFAKESNLTVHKRTHFTGDKPYKRRTLNLNGKFSCSQCPYTTNRKDSIDSHERTHTGAKPFSCESCDKTFAHRSALREHKRTHTGELPYICRFCNKGFNRHTQFKAGVYISQFSSHSYFLFDRNMALYEKTIPTLQLKKF